MLTACLLAGAYGAGAALPRVPFTYLDMFEAETIPAPDGFSRALPVDLNEAGTALCRAEAGSVNPVRGFLRRAGVTIDLGTLGGASTRPLALDDSERVVGTSQGADGAYRPFVWQEGMMTALPLPEGFAEGEARDLLPDGLVGGTVSTATLARAVVWVEGVPSLLPLHPGYACTRLEGLAGAYAVGTAFSAPGEEARGRAVLWHGGELVDLGVTPGYSFSMGKAVNAQGKALVRSFEPPYWSGLSCWTAGMHQRIWGGGIFNDASFIDADGTVCGSTNGGSVYRPGSPVGVIWSGNPKGALFLEDRLVGTSTTVREARAVNSSGRILAELGYAGGNAAVLRKSEAELKVTADVVLPAKAVGEEAVLRFTLENLGPDRAFRSSLYVSLQAGLRAVSGESSRGSLYVGETWGSAHFETMPPGETVTFDLTVQARAPGNLKANVEGRADNRRMVPGSRTELIIVVPGTVRPELTAGTYDPDVFLRRTRRGPGHLLSVSAAIVNDGSAASRATWVEFYLGRKPFRQKGDSFLRRMRVRSLAPGSTQNPGFTLPLIQPPVGCFVLMEIDPENLVEESDETNNVRVSGKLYVETPY